jgi:hypothetical protein
VRAAQLMTGACTYHAAPRRRDGDPGEPGKDAHRFDRLPAAPGVGHQQGASAGAVAVYPGQAASTRNRSRRTRPPRWRRSVRGRTSGTIQPSAARAVRAATVQASRTTRPAPARCALLDRNCPGVQVDDDRGGPRPVLDRSLCALRGRALGSVPAAALPLMPGHLGPHRLRLPAAQSLTRYGTGNKLERRRVPCSQPMEASRARHRTEPGTGKRRDGQAGARHRFPAGAAVPSRPRPPR